MRKILNAIYIVKCVAYRIPSNIAYVYIVCIINLSEILSNLLYKKYILCLSDGVVSL